LQPLLDRLVEAGRYDAVILVTDGYCENLQAKQPTVALITPGGVDAPGLRQSVHLKTVAP
jgi:predicted metal-dependent peptidase